MNGLNFKDIDLASSCFEELSNFFETEKLEQLGREVKFIERSTSRLSAWMFLQLNTQCRLVKEITAFYSSWNTVFLVCVFWANFDLVLIFLWF